jgi:hypothetical protein
MAVIEVLTWTAPALDAYLHWQSQACLRDPY